MRFLAIDPAAAYITGQARRPCLERVVRRVSSAERAHACFCAPQTLAIDGGMTGCSPIKF